jgi:hypothetical protein
MSRTIIAASMRSSSLEFEAMLVQAIRRVGRWRVISQARGRYSASR